MSSLATRAVGHSNAIPKKRIRDSEQQPISHRAAAADLLPAVPRKRSATQAAAAGTPAAATARRGLLSSKVDVRISDISTCSGSTTLSEPRRPVLQRSSLSSAGTTSPAAATTLPASREAAFRLLPGHHPAKGKAAPSVQGTLPINAAAGPVVKGAFIKGALVKAVPNVPPLDFLPKRPPKVVAPPVTTRQPPPAKLNAAVLRQFVGRPAVGVLRPKVAKQVVEAAPAVVKATVSKPPPVRKIAGVPQPQAPTVCINDLVANVTAAKKLQQHLAAPAPGGRRQQQRVARPYDLDEADESDLDFIDDGEEGGGAANWIPQLRAVTGYDPTKFSALVGEAAETSIAEQQREELRSARIAVREDAEELQKLLGSAPAPTADRKRAATTAPVPSLSR